VVACPRDVAAEPNEESHQDPGRQPAHRAPLAGLEEDPRPLPTAPEYGVGSTLVRRPGSRRVHRRSSTPTTTWSSRSTASTSATSSLTSRSSHADRPPRRWFL